MHGRVVSAVYGYVKSNHVPVRHLLRKCVCIYVRSDDIPRASDPDGHVPAVEEAIVIRCSRHLICGVYV